MKSLGGDGCLDNGNNMEPDSRPRSHWQPLKEIKTVAELAQQFQIHRGEIQITITGTCKTVLRA
jgi:hypothetical protein